MGYVYYTFICDDEAMVWNSDYDYDPHTDWGDDDLGDDGGYNDDYFDSMNSEVVDAMQGGGWSSNPYDYSRNFDTDNPASASVRWNDKALETLLNGVGYGTLPNLLDELRDHANGQAETEGAEYGSAVHTPEDRHGTDFPPGGYIYTKNYEARIDEVYHATLLKVLDKAKSLLESSRAVFEDKYTPDLPPGVTSSVGKNGKTYYHGPPGANGRRSFIANPFK